MNQLQRLKGALIAYVNSVKAIWSAIAYPLIIPSKRSTTLKDYHIYGNSFYGKLPSDYQRVEYIESTGKQYLELDYIASNITVAKGTYQLTDTDKGLMLFGSRKSSQTTGIGYALNWGGNSKPYCYYNTFNRGGDSALTTKQIDLDKHELNKDKNKLYIDGELIHTLTNQGTFKTPYNMIIFGCNSNGTISYLSKAKIFNLQFYDNDVLKVDLIPCYRKSDKTVGMYDLVTGTFYINKGTDAFLKGEDVSIQTPESPIEIESVGEFMTEGENEGKYKISVKTSGIEQEEIANIYLDEPLRRIGEYWDYIDFKNKRVVRNVGYKIFDGTEEWVIHTTTNSGKVFRCEGSLSPLLGASLGDTFMTHFALTDVYSTATFENGWYRFAYNQAEFTIASSRLYISAQQDTIEDFIAWLTENKPTITYPLDIPVIENIELPNLPQFKGTTIYEVDTEIKPSGMEVCYYE